MLSRGLAPGVWLASGASCARPSVLVSVSLDLVVVAPQAQGGQHEGKARLVLAVIPAVGSRGAHALLLQGALFPHVHGVRSQRDGTLSG